MTARTIDFTIDTLGWKPWITPVDYDAATPDQIKALSGLPSKLRTLPYSLVLAHDPEALAERVPLFNTIMSAPGGLPVAERELATLVESVLNGCVYCASVHGRRFADLTGEGQVIQNIYDKGFDTLLDSRRRAIVDFAVKLSATPPNAGPEDIAALNEAGLDELEILDLIQSVAMFAWANRLMLTLGEPVPAAVAD
jgi:uncharacterized peroxidase-related enzyme